MVTIKAVHWAGSPGMAKADWQPVPPRIGSWLTSQGFQEVCKNVRNPVWPWWVPAHPHPGFLPTRVTRQGASFTDLFLKTSEALSPFPTAQADPGQPQKSHQAKLPTGSSTSRLGSYPNQMLGVGGILDGKTKKHHISSATTSLS